MEIDITADIQRAYLIGLRADKITKVDDTFVYRITSQDKAQRLVPDGMRVGEYIMPTFAYDSKNRLTGRLLDIAHGD